jgi:hypothetical protein
VDNPAGVSNPPPMPRRSRRCIVLAYTLLLPSLSLGSMAAHAAPAAVAPAPDPHQQINDQIAQADAARKDGRLADAARLYADAYRMTTRVEDYRGSEVALDVALLAAEVYREAFKASDKDYALCEESRELLRAVVDDWTAAGQAVPEAVLEELRWAEARLAEAPRVAPEPEPEPTPEIREDPPHDTGPPIPTSNAAAPRASQGHQTPQGSDSGAAARDGLGIALVSTGAAATVAGVVLLALGAPLKGRATRYRSEALASPEFTERGSAEQAVIEQYLAGYVADEKRRGIGLMVTGGSLIGVGLAGVIVGSLRLVRSARPRGTSAAMRVAPRLSVYHGSAALGVSLEF